jgi:hypothetical protein
MTSKLTFAWLALAALSCAPAHADDGHNHDAAPAASSGPALPRFAATSELFELVGVVNGKQLTVYLDRFNDNTPVQGAKLELDVGGAKVALKEHEPGEFEGSLASELKPGVTAVTATVVAGKESDILATELDVHEEAHAEAAHSHGWREYAGWAAAAVVALGALAFAIRRLFAMRQARVGGAA